MKLAYFLSFLIHLVGFYILDFQGHQKIELQKGGILSLSFFSFSQANGPKAEASTKPSVNTGTLSEAIQEFQNSLFYPPLALEQGWQTDCSWKVEVAETGEVIHFEILQRCQYEIFQTTVESNLKTWKFPTNTIQSFILPVSFRIQGEN
jgi:outer membrane biosynthesis protein TonB